MSSAWKGLGQRHPIKGSLTAQAVGVSESDKDILHLCDTIVVNDLKEEYYYSTNDVAMDAFEAHLKVLTHDSKKYKEIIQIMRPVSLECHKVIAALYLWTRKIDRVLAQDLLKEVRPSWKLTFFKALREAPAYANLKGTWNRSVRGSVRELINTTEPYFIMKYSDKLKPVVAHAHLRQDAKTKWLFNRKEALKEPTYAVYAHLQAVVKNKDTEGQAKAETIANSLRGANLPYTIALGILGSWSTNPIVAKELVKLMTPWETILSIRKIEKTGLNLDDKEVFQLYSRKMSNEKFKTMKIDPVELLQAYSRIENTQIKVLLRNLIDIQIAAISESLHRKIGDAKVAVIFDCSGSMQDVADWSMMLAYACARASKNVDAYAFSYDAKLVDTTGDLFRDIEQLKQDSSLWGGTALGTALVHALKKSKPDVIFFISDFQGNIEPWSNDVYHDYKAMYKTFPRVINIKATSSPWTAMGEYEHTKNEGWLGIPEELNVTIRNLWDLPTILEYVLNLLPKLKEKGILEKPVYVQ